MKNNIYPFFLFFLLLNFPGTSQQGPGGVGSSSDIVFWLDASTINQLNNTPLSSWPDVYSNGVSYTQSVNASKPRFKTSGINGLPTIDFLSTSNTFLQSAAISSMKSNDKSWFIVSRANVSHSGGIYGTLNNASGNAASLIKSGYNSGSNSIFSYHRQNGSLGNGGITFNSSPVIINSIVDQDVSVSHYFNGVLNTQINDISLTPGNHIRNTIGRYPNTTKYFKGIVSEIFHYNKALNSAERVIVTNYLSSKYGLPIPVGEDFYALESSGYFLDLVGIGRINSFTHNDSKGNSIMEISNASSLDVDGDVIMIAHNDVETSTNNTNVPASFGPSNGRVMDRIWRIDYSGTPGTFDLTVHMDGIGFGASNNDYVLIHDTDDDFTSGALTIVPTSVVGDKIIFTGLSSSIIPDGGFFTIATINGIISINGGGDWNDPLTWNCSCVPNGSRNPIITNGNPVNLTTDIDISDLEIESSSSLTIDSDVFLEIYGDLLADGNIIASEAGLIFSGPSSQSVTVGGSNFRIGIIEANNINGVTWTGQDVVLVTALYPELGNFDISGLNSFTLRSNSSHTAYVAAGNSNSSLSGSFTIQRFMPGGNADYRDVTSPGFIASFTDWDDDFIISGSDPLFTDGCAYGNSCFHSIKYWNSITQEYNDVTDPTEPLISYLGYEVFFGEDLNTFGDTTFSVTGPLRNFLNQNLPCRPQWSLIGNLYASQVDWDLLGRGTNIGNFYYIYDTQSGAFEYYDGDNPGSSPLANVISSGQAFWVFNSGGSSEDVTFSQSSKTEDSPTFIRSTSGSDNQFNFSLTGPSKNYHTSSNVVFTHNRSDNSFGVPALITEHQKAPAIYSVVENNKMRSCKLSPSRDEVKVQLGLQFFEDGIHKISFDNNQLFRIYDFVYLIDKASGKMLPIKEGTELRFDAKQQEDEDLRFELLFTNTNHEGFASTERLVDIYKFDNETIKFDLQLNQTAKNINISIFSSIGQLMYINDYQNMDSQILSYQTSDFAPGIYIVNVIIDGQKFVEKVVIE